jgi:hypothetical protein
MSANPHARPPLLDYRHPDTDPPRKLDLSNPRYPLMSAGVMVLIGFLSAPHSWGNAMAVLTLPLIASWYVTVRVWRDERAAPLWRALLLVVGVCCVLFAAWAQTVDYGLPMYIEHWHIYGTVREELYPLAAGITAFALLRCALWALRHVRDERKRAQ